MLAICFLTFSTISPHRATSSFFFFNDTATTEIYTLSLHDALPITRSVSSPTPSTVTRFPSTSTSWVWAPMDTKYFIAPFPPPLCFSRPLHGYHGLHLGRLGEEIERPHGRDAVGRAQPVQVAGQGGRVARDVDQPVDGLSREPQGDVPVQARPGGIHHHRTGLGQCGQHVFRLARDEPHRTRDFASPRPVDRLLVRVHP